MEAFSDIQKLWLSANTNVLPDPKVILETIRAHRRKAILKNLLAIFLGIALLTTMAWVLFSYKSSYITTRLGEAGLLFAISIFLGVRLKIFKNAIDNSHNSNRDYLTALKEQQIIHFNLQHRWQSTGFAIASASLLLYVYEQAEKASVTYVAYPLIISWLALTWFVLVPLARKQRLKKDAADINYIDLIIKQL